MPQHSASNNRGGIQVIERAARILRALKQDQSGMSLGQIAEAVDLPRSTVQRIVGALQNERLIIAGANGGRLRLGPEINSLAEATRYNIVDICRRLLSELSQETGETADLSVMRDDTMVFLDQIPGSHRLRTVSAVGDTFPLTSTANGRACLARLDTACARQLIRAEWDRLAVKADLDAFCEQLAETRKTELAYDLDEHTMGISAVGIAFRDWMGELYAISVPVPSSRFIEVRSRVEDALVRTARHARDMTMRE